MCTMRVITGFLVACALTGIASADGIIVIPHPPFPRPPHPWPVPPDVRPSAPLEITYHHVTAHVEDQVAVTEVDQVFFNPNDQGLEGIYLFPIPKGAHIDKFSLDIDGREVEAELLDAEKARQIYEDIVRRLKDPALLQYAGQSLFKVRVFPIEPRGSKRVRLVYTELLRREGGLVSYVYPLDTEKFSSAPLKSVSVTVDIACTSRIRTVFCPSLPVQVTTRSPTHSTVAYEASNVRPDADFHLFFAPEDAQEVGIQVLTYREVGDPDGGYFLLLASPPIEGARVVDKDVVFVLDTSGSMADRGKLGQATRALSFCLRNLNPHDRFEVIRFSTDVEGLFGGLQEASATRVEEASSFLEGLRPMGGTAIQDALLAAIGLAPRATTRPFMVVFLTDGIPTVGPTAPEEIVRTVMQKVGDLPIRIFCFGLGTDVNAHLLDLLTEKTRAASQYVLPEEDIELKVSSFFTKVSEPVLTDLQLSVGGGVRLAKIVPPHLPDLFKGEQLVVLGRYSGDGRAEVRLAGTAQGASRTFTQEASFPQSSLAHAFIPRLWATRRVGYLLDQIRHGGESPELREEIVDLARRWGIVTPYTAFLIVEDEERRGVASSQRTLPLFDAEVRDATGKIYRELRRAIGGEAGVAGAIGLDALKRAKGVEAPRAASVQMERAGRATVAPEAAERVERVLSEARNQYVAGKTFYLNDSVWVDAMVSSRPQAPRVRVVVGSDEYFALLALDPRAPQWLAVGPRVQVLIQDTVYEVVD